MKRPPLGLMTVLVLLAAGTAVASVVDAPAHRRAGAQAVEVVGATAVCPDVRQLKGFFQTRISVGAAPLPPGRDATGGAVVTTLVRGKSAPVTVPLTEPGQVAIGLGTATNENGVVVSATGALASGLEVEQVFRANDGHYRGLANLRCEAPKRDAWFVGASNGIVDASQLVLANVDDTPATVDITAFGRSGPVDQRPGQGITVPPHSRVAYALDLLAPDQMWLVVHVTSRQGRVVAALRNSRNSGYVQLGFDFVPQALPPATTVVVPGLPQGPGNRGLIIGNPSSDDTTVQVQATVKDGQFIPAGLREVNVPARHSVIINLTDLTANSPLTATVTSSGLRERAMK